jgi:hypothetical protein
MDTEKVDCREDCCGNCEHSIKTDIEGWVICQFDDRSRDDDMLCERYEWNLK